MAFYLSYGKLQIGRSHFAGCLDVPSAYMQKKWVNSEINLKHCDFYYIINLFLCFN